MQTIVGVRFKKAGKIYYFDPGTLELHKDEPVIVETARGLEYGHVVIPARQLEDAEVATPLKPGAKWFTPLSVRPKRIQARRKFPTNHQLAAPFWGRRSARSWK